MFADGTAASSVPVGYTNHGVSAYSAYSSAAGGASLSFGSNSLVAPISEELSGLAKRRNTRFSTGARLYQGNPRFVLVINDVANMVTINIEEGAEKSLEKDIKKVDVLPAQAQLTLIQTELDLSVTQMSELFSVTRKTIYDWMDGTEPRSGALSRISLLQEMISTAKARGWELKRVRTVWNLPLSGSSFRQILANDGLDRSSALEALLAKLDELAPRMGMHSQVGKKINLGDSHISDIDRISNA